MKVFDIASAVIEAKQEELATTHTLNNQNLVIFQGYCRVIDDFIADGWGNKISVDVVTEKNLMKVDIQVMDFTYQPVIRSTNYMDILERAIGVKFTPVDGEFILIEFLFPSLFDPVNQ